MTSNNVIVDGTSFDPQALTSLTYNKGWTLNAICGFDPQALTSLTREMIRNSEASTSFDPQALTSLTDNSIKTVDGVAVSIHRLLRA